MATSSVVLLGASFGRTFLNNGGSGGALSSIEVLERGIGESNRQIVEQGYEFTIGQQSRVAYFPAYPLVSKGIAWLTGLNSVGALVFVANAFSLAAFLLMPCYLRQRSESGPAPGSSRVAKVVLSPTPVLDVQGEVGAYTLLAMGLLPATFFFRMAYSESMFVCVAIVAMYGIVRGWPIVIVAMFVGLATATRPVGIALLLPFVAYVWQTSRSNHQRVWRLAYALPLGCWGILAYMAYQYLQFDDPLAFVRAQSYWRLRPLGTFDDKLYSLASWEPIWGTYVTGSKAYWREPEAIPMPIFNLHAANPIYFVATVVLIAAGTWRRWLTGYEVLLSVPLLLIPYATRGYEMCMAGHGRFAAVVFPVYIVLGHLLARMPRAVAIALLAASGVMMSSYAALFAAGYTLK